MSVADIWGNVAALIAGVAVTIVSVVVFLGAWGGIIFMTYVRPADVERIKRLNHDDIDWIKRRGKE